VSVNKYLKLKARVAELLKLLGPRHAVEVAKLMAELDAAMAQLATATDILQWVVDHPDHTDQDYADWLVRVDAFLGVEPPARPSEPPASSDE